MMKKLLFIPSVFLLAHTAHAQNLSLGPTVGFSHAWISGEDNVRFKPSFNAGATFTYSIVPHFGITADLRCHFFEGVKTEESYGGTTLQNTLNATYLRLPVKFTYFFGKFGDRLRPKVYAGPAVGVLLGGKYKVKPDGQDAIAEGNTTDQLRTMDFGIVAGAGLNYRLKSKVWLNLDVCYNHGFLDVSKADGYNATRDIGITAGVTFPVGTAKKTK